MHSKMHTEKLNVIFFNILIKYIFTVFYEVIPTYVVLHTAEDLYRTFSSSSSERHTKIILRSHF